MAESMAEVEPCADALFRFVLGDDVGFHFAAVIHGAGQFGLVLHHQIGHVLFQPFKKSNIAECAVFDDFGHACG